MGRRFRIYSLSIERDPDGYLPYFPALEGCNTWGKTYEEAVEHAEETLTLDLESFDELGKSIPEERGLKQSIFVGMTVRIPVIV